LTIDTNLQLSSLILSGVYFKPKLCIFLFLLEENFICCSIFFFVVPFFLCCYSTSYFGIVTQLADDIALAEDGSLKAQMVLNKVANYSAMVDQELIQYRPK
jgi:hypothetical protein